MIGKESLEIQYEKLEGFILKIGETKIFSQGKPLIGWRASGQQAWRCEKCVAVNDISISDNKIVIEAIFSFAKAIITADKIEDNVWEFRAEIINTCSYKIELVRFHYWDGVLDEECDFVSTSIHGSSAKRFSGTDAFPPIKDFLEKETWGQWGVQWHRLNDPIHEQSNWATSLDVGILLKGWQDQGIVFGFTGPGQAFGEIGYGTCRVHVIPFYAGVLLDGIEMDPEEKRTMETLLVVSGDWQNGMEHWAAKCADELGVRRSSYPLMGYCSWYQFYSNVTASDIFEAIDEFAEWPIPPGGKTIQIDDGFQIMPGDWRPNSKFSKEWDKLPHKIAEKGLIPGLWLAPTAVFALHPIIKEYPEWIQRLPDGSPAVSFSNWNWCKKNISMSEENYDDKTYFLDSDNPECRKFIAEIIENAVLMGWKYLKLDFTYALSTARKLYNKKKTSFETLRDLFRLVREAAGEEVVICACSGNNVRYALGYADTARLGGDMVSNFQSVMDNLSDLILRMCTNGIWWQGDPDIFYMRSQNTELSPTESWLLSGTIGLLGGVFITSDLPSQWDKEGTDLIKLFWNSHTAQIPNNIRTIRTREGKVLAVKRNQFNGGCMIGIYNWNSEVTNIRLCLNELNISTPFNKSGYQVMPRDQEISIDDEYILSRDQPPHSLRIVILD